VAAARLVGLEGKVGHIAPGSWADLLVVDGNPVEDITVLTAPDKHLKLVMKAGVVVRNQLS
jgi:imidazolonepropionase-like amidohydrolase